MKILIATGLYFPDIGGPATYTKFLERHLPSHGIDFDVVAFTGVRKYPKIIRHLVYTFLLLSKGRGVDVIYALDTVSVGVPALVASFILRKKLYLRVPGDYAWEQGQQRFGITDTLDEYLTKKEKPFPVRVLAWLQTRVARSATRVVVPSDYMKGVVGAWGIQSEKITRVYSALNPVIIAETKDDLRAHFGYEGFVVLTAARLVPWKGIAALIDASIKLKKTGLNIILEIVGDGVLEAELKEHIQKNNATTYVNLRGKLPKEELAKRVKASDAFVLNTSYEGLSHQLLEVMDIGTPIVTTPVGGNVELIADQNEGLLVGFNDCDAIVRALSLLQKDTEKSDMYVRNAREKAKLFREDIIIPEIISLFS
jgi:glycosyltransferase involved in cell wall biosynthesis